MIYFQVSETLQPEEGEMPEGLRYDEAALMRAAQETLVHESAAQEADLTILLSDDSQLRELNRQYLGIDSPTDVLSFPAGERDPETEAVYLGDVLISYERARLQAETAGHPVEDELQLLVVHGVLHLLGHDHAEEDEKAVMWAAQAEILRKLGLGSIYIPD